MAGANFKIRTLAKDLSPEKCTYRFLALQRSGNYSELRIVQQGRGQRYSITGYKWPTRKARRAWGVGKSNPKIFKVGTPVIIRVPGSMDKALRKGETGIVVDPKGYVDQRTAAEMEALGWVPVMYATKPALQNLSVRYFPASQLTVAPWWRKNPAPCRLGENIDAELLKIQFRLTEIYYLIADKRDYFTAATALIPVIRKIYQLRGYSDNPTTKYGPTANQVIFSQRGKRKVGWIHKATPTRYEVAYKDGPRLKTVWRKKNLVAFQATDRRGKVKNDCPGRANPEAIARAAGLSETFHGFKPRYLKHRRIDWPQALTQIGHLVQVDYLSDKFDGKMRRYYHEFDAPVNLYADADAQPGGNNILIALGKFKIKKEGITG